MSKHHDRIKNDPRWHAARAACLERDGYACVDCGTTDDLQADHVLGLADNPDLAFVLENLLTRCGPCNRRKHREGGDNVIIRKEWVNSAYPEVIIAIDAARSLTTA